MDTSAQRGEPNISALLKSKLPYSTISIVEHKKKATYFGRAFETREVATTVARAWAARFAQKIKPSPDVRVRVVVVRNEKKSFSKPLVELTIE